MNSINCESSHCINICEINTTTTTHSTTSTNTTTTITTSNNNAVYWNIQSDCTQFYTRVVFIMDTLI